MSAGSRVSAWAALPLLGLLGGCIGAAAEGANIVRDRAVFNNNIAAAQAGDVEAEYAVGAALCCSINEGEGFYNTPVAVSWLCRAATQGHGPAALRLADIYSGDVVDGIRLMRRVAQGVAGTSTNLPVAYAWAVRADMRGVEGARSTVDALWADLAPEDHLLAQGLATDHSRPLPCEWDEVIGS